MKKFDAVRILGTVTKIRRKTSNFTSFVLDDGFGDVIVKIPERVEVDVGDIVEVFGKPKEDFLFADKVFKRDIYYEMVRLLELKKIKDILPKVEETEETEKKFEKVSVKCSEEDIISFIMELLEEKEVFELHEVYKEFEGNEDKVDRVIEKLKSEGIIFEEVPGRYRKL